MRIINLPCNYVVSIGLKETVFLSYLIDTISKFNSTLPFFQVNKKDILSKSWMNCIKQEEISGIIDKLFSFGLVFKCRKSGKITRKITLNVINMAFYEMFGEEKYIASLKDFENKKYIGKYISRSDIENSTDIDFAYPIINKYIANDLIERKKCLEAIYDFDISKTSSHIKDGKFIYKKDTDGELANIESMFLIPLSSQFFKDDSVYGINLISGIDKFVLDDLPIESDESDSDEEVSEKDLARNDLIAYYRYLRIGDTLKKPIINWTVRDFIAYLYCGMAKQKELVGGFIFPDFKKDAYKFKLLMNKYGNKNLNRLIYYAYKHTNEISDHCRIKNFNPTVSTFFVDWIVKKIFEFIEYYENNAQYDRLSKILNSQNQDKIKSEQKLEKENDDVKLNMLRKEFNENKPLKQ